jgi:hypothetical protein
MIRVIRSRKVIWPEHVVHIWDRRDVYRILVGKPEGKRPIGRPRRRVEDSIKFNFKKYVGGGLGENYLAQDRDGWREVVRRYETAGIAWLAEKLAASKEGPCSV